MANYHENQTKLDEEICRVLKTLGATKPGTDEYKAVASCLSVLNNMRQEQEKIDLSAKKQEADFRQEQEKIDLSAKKQEAEIEQAQEKIDLSAKKQEADVIIGASGLGVSLLTAVGYVFRDWKMFTVGLKFEETGSIQSLFGRSICQRIFKK